MKRLAIPFILIVLYFSCGNKKTQASEGVLPPVVTHEVLHNASAATVWVNDKDSRLSLVIGADNDAEGALYAYNLKGGIEKKSAIFNFLSNPVVLKGLAVQGRTTDAVIIAEAFTKKVRVLSLPGFEPLDNGGIPVLDEQDIAVAGDISVWTRPSDKAVFVTVANMQAGKDCLYQYRLLANARGVSLCFVRKFGAADGEGVRSMAVNAASGYLYCGDAIGIKQYVLDPALEKKDAISVFNCSPAGNLVVHTAEDKVRLLASSENEITVMALDKYDGSIKGSYRFSEGLSIAASSSLPVGPAYKDGVVIGLNHGMNFCYYKKQEIDKYIKF